MVCKNTPQESYFAGEIDFGGYVDRLIAEGHSDEEIAEEVSTMDGVFGIGGVELVVALYRVLKERTGK